MPPKKVIIWWDPQVQGYVMASPYNEAFMNAWKAIIPAGARHWDKDKKLWFLNEPYGEAVHRVAETCFGKDGVQFRSKTEVESRQGQMQPHSVNGLGKVCHDFVALLDYDEAKSLYRKALMRLHPDRGGSAEKTAQLNLSWKEIEKEIFKKGA